MGTVGRKYNPRTAEGTRSLGSLGGGRGGQLEGHPGVTSSLWPPPTGALGESGSQGPRPAEQGGHRPAGQLARPPTRGQGAPPVCHSLSLRGVSRPERQESKRHFLHPRVPRHSLWQDGGPERPSHPIHRSVHHSFHGSYPGTFANNFHSSRCPLTPESKDLCWVGPPVGAAAFRPPPLIQHSRCKKGAIREPKGKT